MQRPLNLGGARTTLGWGGALPQLPANMRQTPKPSAPEIQTPDDALARALARSAGAANTPTVESGNVIEALAAALEGGLHGRAQYAQSMQEQGERTRARKIEDGQRMAYSDALAAYQGADQSDPDAQTQALIGALRGDDPEAAIGLATGQIEQRRAAQRQSAPEWQVDDFGRPYSIQNGRVVQGEGQVGRRQPVGGGGGGAMPTLAEARQWTNSYNDDIRTVNNDLGNMRAAIPYATQVVRAAGAPTGNFRMNDVALIRAAARAQTGPGVLTETEVFGTLSPSLRQDLIRARSYADIAQAGLRPEDRLALARYVENSARNASGDLWRRYQDAENVLSPRNIDPSNVGISAPEYVHPDDMDSFMSQPESNFQRGHKYVAPSGRQYEYLGDGRFRYVGRNRYDPSLRVDRERNSTQEPGSLEPPPGVDPQDWQYMTPEERRLFQQ